MDMPQTSAVSARFQGVIPPVLTPLTPAGELDRDSLERLVERLIDAGVHGLFALGSSAESAFFTDERRIEVLGAIMAIVDGRVPVLAGLIDMQTGRALQQLRAVEELGVAAVMATAPFYAITGPEEIDTHFRTLAAAASTPLMAYDIPICTNVKLLPEHLMRLGQDGVLAGVKDSSGDDVSFRRLSAMNSAAGSPMTLLTGHEVVVDGAYLAGAHGAMPGIANVEPTGYVRMWEAYQAGDWERVRKEQDQLAALFEIVFAVQGKVGPAAGIGAFKTALQLLGVISSNAVSNPMTALEGPNVEAVRAVLQRTGLL